MSLVEELAAHAPDQGSVAIQQGSEGQLPALGSSANQDLQELGIGEANRRTLGQDQVDRSPPSRPVEDAIANPPSQESRSGYHLFRIMCQRAQVHTFFFQILALHGLESREIANIWDLLIPQVSVRTVLEVDQAFQPDF